ncbi:MAG TPA: nucleoside phosphorylase [Candidatus Nanoarchaeia archaeon]|nr:nucleoside phosphorylase [Candidatus Nanoarchaeia archaeon]
MAYPNFDNKHLEESLFGPQDRPSFKKVPKNLPKKYILIYDRNLKARIKRKLSPKKISKLSRTLMDFYCYKDVGIIFMKGVGSPHAVMALEQLIAYGGKIFLNIGSAGGLKEEGFFLCKKALRDEGTSYHYISQGEYSYPNNFLTNKFGKFMKKERIHYNDCISWTIDAPYMETKAEIEKYSKKGITTVEMEASALFAVASIKKVKIASAFVVSDILGEKWESKFSTHSFKRGIDTLFYAALKFLEGPN